ncbi:MAG TPA: hypothetical protein VGD07_22365 [Methylomirabilota bacterium]
MSCVWPASTSAATPCVCSSRTLLRRLGGLTVGERAALPCLEPGRADLIVAGTAIVLATLDLTGAGRMVVSDRGLREGILARLSVSGLTGWGPLSMLGRQDG